MMKWASSWAQISVIRRHLDDDIECITNCVFFIIIIIVIIFFSIALGTNFPNSVEIIVIIFVYLFLFLYYCLNTLGAFNLEG